LNDVFIAADDDDLGIKSLALEEALLLGDYTGA